MIEQEGLPLRRAVSHVPGPPWCTITEQKLKRCKCVTGLSRMKTWSESMGFLEMISCTRWRSVMEMWKIARKPSCAIVSMTAVQTGRNCSASATDPKPKKTGPPSLTLLHQFSRSSGTFESPPARSTFPTTTQLEFQSLGLGTMEGDQIPIN